MDLLIEISKGDVSIMNRKYKILNFVGILICLLLGIFAHMMHLNRITNNI